MNRNRLEAKIRAVNAANKVVNELYPKLIEAVKPFVGLPILKVDGMLLKKVETVINAVLPEYNHDLRVTRDHSDYSLRFSVSASSSYTRTGSTDVTEYHESTVYIGSLKGAVLESLNTHEERKTDYDIENILLKFEERDAAKRTYDNLQSQVGMFQVGY